MIKIKKKVMFMLEGVSVTGYSHLEEGFRISDHLNKTNLQFIPLTDVVFMDEQGTVIKEDDFVCVNKDAIVMAKDLQEE